MTKELSSHDNAELVYDIIPITTVALLIRQHYEKNEKGFDETVHTIINQLRADKKHQKLVEYLLVLVGDVKNTFAPI